MLETPHVVVGAAIASKIINPALALPLAFGSHFLLETIPHWNPHLNTELTKYGKLTTQTRIIITADVVASLAIGSYIAYRALPNAALAITILLASFAAILPDLVEAPYFFCKYKNKLLLRWITWQKSIQEDAGVFLGLSTQLVTIITALWWIFI
jgi:hypothetical protein